MLIIGSHVSYEKGQLLGSTKEAISYGATALMFYTGAPVNTYRTKIDENYTKEAYKLMQENNINIDNVICHAPYIINLADSKDTKKYEFGINFLKKEIDRCETLGVKNIVLHPGCCVGSSKEEAIESLSLALNKILNENMKCKILIETMAGKGSEIGSSISEIKSIIDKVELKDYIGVCIDTCHINDAGYDVNKFDEYLIEFDKNIGLDKIGCLHINDSKNVIASHKDRHANIGFGTIGFDALINVVYNEKLKNIPKILETPYIGEDDNDKKRIYPPYKFEIEMIKKKAFNPHIMEDIRNFYKL